MIRNAFGLHSDIVVFIGDNTGNVDVVADLEAFMEANPGKMVQLGEGTYKFSRALDPDCSILLRGISKKTTVIKYPALYPAIHGLNNYNYQLANTTQMVVTSITEGLAPDGFSVTTDADKVQVLTVSGTIDPTKFIAGGIVAITASDTHPVGGSRRMGETMKLRYVDVANSKLYLEGYLAQGSASYTTNIRVNTLSDARDMHVSHIGFTADGTWDDISIDSPPSLHNHAIICMGTPYAHIHDCEFDKLWEGAVQVSDGCPFSIVENLFGRHLPNLMTGVVYALGTNPLSTDTATNTGGNTTITVAQTAHPWKVGSRVTLAGLSSGTYNGLAHTLFNTRVTVTAVTTDTWKFQVVGTASGTGSFGGSTIEAELNGRLGYGVSVGTLSGGTIVRNCVFHEARHAFTTDGHGDSTWTAGEWLKYGQPTHVTFEDCHARNAWGVPFDTHEEGSHIIFKNCSSTHGNAGIQGGSYKGFGMQLRASNVKVIGYRQFGGQYGIRIPAVARLAGNEVIIKDVIIEDLRSSSDVIPTTGNSVLQGSSTRNSAIVMEDMTSTTNPPVVHIDGLVTNDVNQSITHFGGAVKILLGRGDFKKNGIPIELMAGAELIVTGQTVFDFAGTARTPTELNCVHMWAMNGSKVTGTGAKAIFLVKPIVIKDNSNTKPVAFFKEGDTVANKTYYADGITEYNANGVTGTLLVSAGATTMVQATTIRELGAILMALKDSDGTHTLRLKAGSNLTADRDLTFTTGDAARTITLTGDTSLEGTNTGDGKLSDYTTTNPATPASGLQMFARNRTGRRTPALIGPTGLVAELQNSIATKKFWAWLAAGAGSSVLSAIATSSPTVSGTANSVSATFSTILGAFRRLSYDTTVAAAQVAGIKNGIRVARGNAAGVGGFHLIARFSIDSVAAGHAIFVGFDPTTAALADGDPSALVNICGFGADAADSNLQWMVNDASGTATKVDLGANFPAKTVGAIYEARIFCKPNDTVLYYSLQRLDSAQFVEGSSNTDLPVNTTGICAGAHVFTRADTTTAAKLGISSMYCETEL